MAGTFFAILNAQDAMKSSCSIKLNDLLFFPRNYLLLLVCFGILLENSLVAAIPTLLIPQNYSLEWQTWSWLHISFPTCVSIPRATLWISLVWSNKLRPRARASASILKNHFLLSSFLCVSLTCLIASITLTRVCFSSSIARLLQRCDLASKSWMI